MTQIWKEKTKMSGKRSEGEMYAMKEGQTGTKAVSSVLMPQVLSKCFPLVAWGFWAGG